MSDRQHCRCLLHRQCMLLQMCCPRMQCRYQLHREDMLHWMRCRWMDCRCLLDRGYMMPDRQRYRYLLRRQGMLE